MPLANITQLEPFNINSSASFTFANVTSTGNVTSTYFIGNGSQLTGISAGSTYSNANVAAYLPTFSGNSAAGNFIGNGYFLTSINASNIAGQVANALVAGTVYSNAQPNITSLGTLASLTVSGLVTATAGGIKVGNLQDTSGTNTIQLTNSDILVTGNISAGTGGAGNVTATYFIGNGSQLTGLPASYSNTNVDAYLPTFSGNIGANFITATGNVTAGNLVTSGSGGNLSGANYVIANYFSGNGSALTSITGANVTGTVANATYATSAGTATTAGTVTTAAQPNITSTGTLAGVTATGTINLTSASNVSLGPVANIHITGGTSGQYLKTDGSGTLSWADAGNATAIINGTSNVVVSADSNVTMGISGNAAIFTATGTGVNISGYLTSTGNVTAGNLVTSGSGGNLSGANYVIANYFVGDGSQLTGLPASYSNTNVDAYLPTFSGLIGGTLSTTSQPNITSVGTLTSLTVSGLVTATAGGIKVGNLQDTSGTNTVQLTNSNMLVTGNITAGAGGTGNVSATYFIGNGSSLTNITGGNVAGQVGNALVAGTVYSNAQPNITSVGSLTGLTVSNSTGVVNFTTTANVTLGSVGNLHISGGSANYVLRTDGAGSLSWVEQSGGGGGGTTITVDTFTGNGVQVAFTLSTSPTDVNYTVATVQGVVQPRSYYTVVGTTLTFSTAPPDTTVVEVTTFASGGGSGSSTAAAVGYSLVFGG